MMIRRHVIAAALLAAAMGGLATVATPAARASSLFTTSSCPGVGSTCVAPQALQVNVDPGELAISTPYTATSPFVMPAMTLSSDGTYLFSSAPFPASSNPNSQQIVVASTLAGDPGWTLSVTATDLTNGGSGTISASGFGLTNGQLINSGTFPGIMNFTNIPALNPSPIDGPGTGPGLGPSPQIWASTPAGDGTAVMEGMLTLLAPTSTPPGTYSGTITFSVS
jgi:hypothetical protein